MAFSPEVSGQQIEAYPSYVEVTGYAEKEIAPDVFYMRVDINESDSKGKKTVEQQQSAMLSALKSLGVNVDRQVTRLSLSSSFFNKKTNMASASYQIKLGSSESVSKVWQKLDGLGISKISFTRAEYSKMEEFKDSVRVEAVKNARREAETMAGAIGQKVGKCFYMYLGNGGNYALYAAPRVTKSALMMNADSVAEEETSIEFDSIKVSMSVQAKFVLE